MKSIRFISLLAACLFAAGATALEFTGTYQLQPTAGAIDGATITISAESISAFPDVQDMMDDGFRTSDGKFAMRMFHYGSGWGFFDVNPRPDSIQIVENNGSNIPHSNGWVIYSPNARYSQIIAVWDTPPASLTYGCDDYCLVSRLTDPVGIFYFEESFDGTDDGPNLEDPSAAFSVSGGQISRNSCPNVIENNRHMVRTTRSDYNTADWIYTLDFNSTFDREIIYIGMGAGEADSTWLGEPGDSVHFRIHTAGIDGGRSVHVMERTLGQGGWNYLIPAGNMPGEGSYTARIVKRGNDLTFSIDGLPISATVPVPAFLDDSNSRLFFGVGDCLTTFDNMVVQPLPTNEPPVAACQDVAADTYPLGACSANVYTDDGSSDPDGDDLNFVQVPAGPYELGATSVTLTVDDGELSSSCSSVVTVTDGENPSLSCSAPQVLECVNGGASGVFSTVAADNCSVGPVSCNAVSGDTFPLGDSSISCSVSDGSSNTASCDTSIQVVDTIAPAINCPVLEPVECTSPEGAEVSFAATATDACGVGSPDCASSGSVFAIGDSTASCSVTDLGGNGSSCDLTVAVVDTTPPAVSCGIPEGGISGSDLPLSITATVEDVCSAPEVTVSFTGCTSDKNGSSTGCSVSTSGANVLIEELGKGKSVNWTASATDPAGNSTTVECSVSRGASNQGLGNGAEGSDPGNSNQGDPSNSNDENGGTPGNPGKKKGKG